MKRMIRLVSFLCMALILSGCGAKNASQLRPVGAGNLLHHSFELVSVNGKAITRKERIPSLEFGENLHVSGSACNRFAGQGQVEAGVLTVRNMAFTRMMCAEDELNQLDQLIAKMFEAGAHLGLSKGMLYLWQGEDTLVYIKKDFMR